MKGTRASRRYQVETKQRECSLCVITFKDLQWKDHTALLVDISRHGAGIESEGRIDPGFVWFHDRLGGNKSGVLMWSRQAGPRYRAGIRFIPLSRREEQFIGEQISLIRANKPVQDPVAVITTIMESLTNASVLSSPAPAPSPAPAAPAAPAAAGAPRDDADDDIIQDLRDIVARS